MEYSSAPYTDVNRDESVFATGGGCSVISRNTDTDHVQHVHAILHNPLGATLCRDRTVSAYSPHVFGQVRRSEYGRRRP